MSTRREFIKQTSIITGAGLMASIGIPLFGHAASNSASWRMLDEGETQQYAFIAFGAQRAVWQNFTSDVQDALGRIARAIAEYQPLIVFCRKNERQLAEDKCGNHNITFVITELDDIWMRDIGATFVTNSQGELGAVDFNFNGWGDKQIHSKDARLARFEANYFNLNQHFRCSKLIGEGGGIEVDGHGTGIMTESSWVNENRNPKWSREQVEEELKEMLGLRKIIWLPGIKDRDITDAHVDFYARFVSPGVVVANLDNDPESYDYEVTRVHLDILKQATDADGRKLQVHTISPPMEPRYNRFSKGNEDFAAGYINYFIINGAVIAPEFGDPDADEKARQLLTALYPERKIVQLNIDAIAAGGGGIHCVTNQMPSI